jgi:hypothetical protein
MVTGLLAVRTDIGGDITRAPLGSPLTRIFFHGEAAAKKVGQQWSGDARAGTDAGACRKGVQNRLLTADVQVDLPFSQGGGHGRQRFDFDGNGRVHQFQSGFRQAKPHLSIEINEAGDTTADADGGQGIGNGFQGVKMVVEGGPVATTKKAKGIEAPRDGQRIMPLGQFGYLLDAFRQGRHMRFKPSIGGIDRKIKEQRVPLLLQFAVEVSA